MSKDGIKIPSRTLTEILAGTLDYYRASEDDQGRLSSIAWMKEYFRGRLRAGRTISAISVETCPDVDDDWIMIEYGPPDPAISVFA